MSDLSQQVRMGNIPDQFHAVVDAYPDHIALEDGDRVIRFHELDRLTNRLARALLDALGEGEELVALLFEHDLDMLVAVLGVVKAGKAYWPLDDDMAVEQLKDLMGYARPRLLLTHDAVLPKARELVQKLPHETQILDLSALDPGLSDARVDTQIGPETIAAILLTSGSTGQPKIVRRSHQTILINTERYASDSNQNPDDRVALTMSYTFGWSRSVIFRTLLSGEALLPYNMRRLGFGPFENWLRERRATRLPLVSSVFRRWLQTLESPVDLPHLRMLITGGDVLTGDDVKQFRRFFSPTCKLTTGLGLSELGGVTRYVIDHDTPLKEGLMPVGYPVAGREILILDDDRQEAPAGEVGEIVIRSAAVTVGYGGDSAANQSKFVPDPHDPDRTLFYTGDLGKLREDGCLILVGRKDSQIKIRGAGVILQDVERYLKALLGVAEAAAAGREIVSGDLRLVAYLVPQSGVPRPTDSTLRGRLSETLPGHMIPSQFVWLDQLPRLPSGKLDRRSLPAPEATRPPLSNAYAPPADPVQARLVAIWEDLLGISPVGVDDKFFDLGGHSLLASAVVVAIEKQFGQTLSMARLSQAPTIREIARLVQEPDADLRLPSLVAIKPEGSRPPLFCVHPRGGLVGLYHHLARRLDPDQPVYGLQAQGLDGLSEPHRTVSEMANYYIGEIRKVQPHGPYHLTGFSMGGLIAHEMACQLQAMGEQVGALIFLDSHTSAPLLRKLMNAITGPIRRLGAYIEGAAGVIRGLAGRPPGEWRSYWGQRRQRFAEAQYDQRASQLAAADPFNQPHATPESRVLWANRQAGNRHQRKQFEGRAIFFLSSRERLGRPSPARLWAPYVTGGVDVIVIPGGHRDMIEGPGVPQLAAHLDEALGRQS